VSQPPTVVVFHSMYGRRPVEWAAADRLHAAGWRVALPDLYDGAVAGEGGRAPAVADGLALMDRIGWDTITARALDFVRELPPDTVLCGLSMGCGVVGALWPERLAAAGVILLHATTQVPEGVPPGTPVQTQVGEGDPFAPPEALADFRATATRAGADASLHTYPGAAHFYTDESLPDYDAAASERTWRRVRDLLVTVRLRAT
jgi:dienelactone hydrolase